MKESSYAELKAELEALQKRTEQARLAEIQAVAQRAAAMLNEYQVSLAELRAAGYRPADDLAKRVGRPRRAGGSAEPKTSSAREVKFRDPSNEGNTWSGRGARPKWIREALAAGRTLESFRVA